LRGHADIVFSALRVCLFKLGRDRTDPCLRRGYLCIALEDSPLAAVDNLLQVDAINIHIGRVYAIAVLIIDEEFV